MVNTTEEILSISHEQIVFEILKRLPVKSLSRFKCVSVNWLRLIEDPYFVKCHGAHSRTRRPGGIQLLVCHTVSPYNLVARSYIFSDPDGNHSSDSIILPTDFPSYNKDLSNAEALLCFDNGILNPLTRESIDIPSLPYNRCLDYRTWNSHTSEYVNIPMLDHDGHPYLLGYLLGFDAFTTRYKLVSWTCNCALIGDPTTIIANQVPPFHVLTLGENSWKPIPIIPDELREGAFEVLSSLSISNMIFCLMRCTITTTKQIYGVMTFDVQHEHVRFIPFKQEDKFHIRLAEIQGRLAIQGIGRSIWVLNHEINEWTKMEINVPGCSELFGDEYIMTGLILIATLQTNEILFQCNAVEKAWKHGIRLFKYFYYDPETEKIRFIPKLDKTVDEEWDYMIIKHVDSFVTLKKLNATG